MFFLPNKYLDRLLVYASMSEFAKKDYIFTTGSSGWKSVRYQKVDLLKVNSTTHAMVYDLRSWRYSASKLWDSRCDEKGWHLNKNLNL